MPIRKDEVEERVMIAVSRDCRNNIKIVAALNGQTIREWLEWTAKKAYEAEMKNRGRKSTVIPRVL